MHWLSLFAAGLFEIVFTISLKESHGDFRIGPVVAICISAILSFGLLWYSLKTIPIGTAYAIWTGMGVIGAATAGILYYKEPATAARIVCIALIAAGGIGLRLAGVQK